MQLFVFSYKRTGFSHITTVLALTAFYSDEVLEYESVCVTFSETSILQ